jgi:hypothetical protein
MAQQASTGDPNLFANYLFNGYSSTPNTGPFIYLSGMSTVFPGTYTIPNVPQQPWLQPNIVINTPQVSFTPYVSGSINLGSMHKDAFITFVRAHLTGKCLVFVEPGDDKYRIVNKIEALKFAWFHFCNMFVAPNFKSYKELQYSDEEWTIFFKPAETSEELLEAFEFTFDQICEALSI